VFDWFVGRPESNSIALRDFFDVALAALFGAVAVAMVAPLTLLRVVIVGLRGRV
jgi:hypothetical protein